MKRVIRKLLRPFGGFITARTNCPHCGSQLVAEYERFPSDPLALGPCPVCGKSFPLFDNSLEEEIFLRTVDKYDTRSPGCTIPLTSVEGFKVSSIQEGILFVLALWSGPARVSLQCLGEVLSGRAFQNVKLYVVNIDVLTTDVVNRELQNTPLGGWEETYGIKGGAIQHTLMKYTSEQANVIVEFT